ncbi:hypothetical protein [Mesorhizobium sp. CN2-181]|uniref:hypothetical protein n=1 Tax=Mesorhizobium yinganensis TaxID=3157707 RepID=UPI0032B85A2A
MTIAERRAREEYDRENPWRPLAEAVEDGSICELRMSNAGEPTDLGAARFTLRDGAWYRIEPPKVMSRFDLLVEFRPTGFKLASHRLHSVVARAERGTHEYIGGKLYRKPKPYKLYWRSE